MAIDLRTVILASPDLPTLPVVASRLLALTANEETHLAEIADLVAQDMALSAKLLRVVNSSFYGLPRRIGSIQQAVTMLGVNAVRSIVLSFSFFTLPEKKNALFDFDRFWKRSLAGAVAARVIAEHLPQADREEAFIAGLLSNIGQLALAAAIPGQYQQALQAAGKSWDDIEEAEESHHLGVAHGHIGEEIAGRWGLPDLYRIAIRHHHDPARYPGTDEHEARVVRIVHLADLLAAIFTSPTPEVIHQSFRHQARKLLGLDDRVLDAIVGRIAEAIDASAHSFGLDLTPTRSVAEILEEANQRLTQLHLSYEAMNRELVRSKQRLEQLQAELSHKNALLEQLANIDDLTGMANHRHFRAALDRELDRATDNNANLSLLMVDIDRFKSINDSRGHQVGDAVLREFCRQTAAKLRNYDLLARYGGEEFAVLLPETGADEAMIVAEKIRRMIEQHPFVEPTDPIRVTVSIGIAATGPRRDRPSPGELIGLADQALYEAKNSGRNRSVLAHSGSGDPDNTL